MRLFKPALCLAVLLCAVSAPASAAQLRVANWNDYIDPSVIAAFIKQSGIEVSYQHYETEEQYTALLASTDSPDVVVPGNTRLKQMIEADLLQPYEASALPRSGEILPTIKARMIGQDPERQYAVPYLWGRIGLLVDRSKVEAALGSKMPNTWGLVFDQALTQVIAACGISVLESRDDIYSLWMTYRGLDASKPTARTMRAFGEQLLAIRPLYRHVDNAAYISAANEGELCVSMAWEGDGKRIAQGNKQLEFILPQEGTVQFLDVMAISKASRRVAEAKQFIAFMISEQSQASTASHTGYNSPYISGEGSTQPGSAAGHAFAALTPASSIRQRDLAKAWARFTGWQDLSGAQALRN
jgi:spermidine/putrescine-binding protein